MYAGKGSQEQWLYKAMTFEHDVTGIWVVVSENGQPSSWRFPAGARMEALLRQGWQLVKPLANLHQRGETEYLTLVLRQLVPTTSRDAAPTSVTTRERERSSLDYSRKIRLAGTEDDWTKLLVGLADRTDGYRPTPRHVGLDACRQ